MWGSPSSCARNDSLTLPSPKKELKHASIEAIVALEVGKLKFLFNGFPEEIEGCELVVQHLLDRTNEDDPAVIVEINGRFIYRKDFSSTKINEGDRVEFIHPSFGG